MHSLLNMKRYVKEVFFLRESDFAAIESLIWCLQMYKLINEYLGIMEEYITPSSKNLCIPTFISIRFLKNTLRQELQPKLGKLSISL